MIHTFEGFPNPAYVRVAFAEIGISYQMECIVLNVPEGAHRTAPFLTLNPADTLLKRQDRTSISACIAITEYINHPYGDIRLTVNHP